MCAMTRLLGCSYDSAMNSIGSVILYKEETLKEINSFLPSVTILSDKTEQEYEIDFVTPYKFAVPVFIG